MTEKLEVGETFEIYGSEFEVLDVSRSNGERYYLLKTPHDTTIKAHEKLAHFMKVYPD